MQSSLKDKAIYGMIWVSFQKFGAMGIAFISNIVLARLLSPDDYGCIGLLAIFITISNTFVFGGFSAALIQKQNPTRIDYSTVFYWNVFIAILSYIILFITAPYIASFYHIPKLSSILRILSLVIIINSFSIVQLNIRRKQLKFKSISIIQIIAISISVIVTIYLALKGFGIWSLVCQQLITSSITTILLWISSVWKPILAFSFKSLKELFSYGSFLLLSDLLNSICDNIQGIIIGRKYTADIMGYYSQAKKMEEIPTTSISYTVQQVTFPIYSKLQNDTKQLFNATRKSLLLMNYINIPLMFLLIVVAEPLFTLLFSEKWLPSVPYFKILCLAGLVNCSQSINYQVVCAVGKSNKIFKWNIIKRLLGIIFIVIGMNWGVKGILFAMVIGFYTTFIINAIVATKETGYSLLMQIKDMIPIITICILTSLITNALANMTDYNYILSMIFQIILFLFVYVFASWIIKREELKEYINIIKSIF